MVRLLEQEKDTTDSTDGQSAITMGEPGSFFFEEFEDDPRNHDIKSSYYTFRKSAGSTIDFSQVNHMRMTCGPNIGDYVQVIFTPQPFRYRRTNDSVALLKWDYTAMFQYSDSSHMAWGAGLIYADEQFTEYDNGNQFLGIANDVSLSNEPKIYFDIGTGRSYGSISAGHDNNVEHNMRIKLENPNKINVTDWSESGSLIKGLTDSTFHSQASSRFYPTFFITRKTLNQDAYMKVFYHSMKWGLY